MTLEEARAALQEARPSFINIHFLLKSIFIGRRGTMARHIMTTILH